MKYWIIALRFKILMLLLLGLIYPFCMTGLSQIFFKKQAAGDLSLIAQKFEAPKYFWPRPSAVDYNPLASGGSNLGPTSQDLAKVVSDRKLKLISQDQGTPPFELLYASASGLDPDISILAAEYQVARISRVREIDVQKLDALIIRMTKPRDLIIFGEPRVNVLALNSELDKMKGP